MRVTLQQFLFDKSELNCAYVKSFNNRKSKIQNPKSE